MKSLRLTLLVALALPACDDPKPKPTPTASATPSALASSSAGAAPSAKPAPWYVGSFAGRYVSAHYKIPLEKKAGAIREWADDEGKAAAGPGTVKLTIAEDKSVTGESSGALGDMKLTGALDGDVLSVRLLPKKGGPIASAFFTAKRDGEGFTGQIRASSGDSTVVRLAGLTLTKGSDPSKAAEPKLPAPPASGAAAPSAASSAAAPPGKPPASAAAPK